MRNLIIYSLLFISIILSSSCKRYKEEFVGPALGLAPDDFTASALTASSSLVDFTTDTVSFQSSFNATVRWTLTITGQQSGAVKVFTAVSSGIDASNASWTGSTDTLKLFEKNETVTAVLSVYGWNQTLSTTLTIANTKPHGYVLGRYENISVNTASKNWLDPSGFYWFYSFETNELDAVAGVADASSPEGNYYLRIAGHDLNQSYYIGKVGLSAPGSPAAGSAFNFGTTNLASFYFNVYVKGAGSATNKDYKMVIETYEDDAGDGLQYNNTEDKYSYTMSLKYDGWKLFRIKYSDFVLDAATTSTYRNHSPDKIGNIGFFIGANTSDALSASDVADTGIDFFTVTTNGPLVP